MTSNLAAGRNASAVLPPIALPLTLCALLTLGLVAMQAHLLCDVFCLHGQAHTVSSEICRG